jgi:hypothetical protein
MVKTIIYNPEIKNTLKNLQMIYLQNIIINSEMKLFLLTSILAFAFHNSSNMINNDVNNNISNQLSY